jgi:hypothetical protein
MLVDFSLGVEADFPFTTMRPDVEVADLGTKRVHEEMASSTSRRAPSAPTGKASP